MANENEEKRETRADIADEIRRAVESMGDEIPYTASAGTMRRIADRIEAAWKREKAAIEADALAVGGIVEAARHTPGNAAAMRAALMQVSLSCSACPRHNCKGCTRPFASFMPAVRKALSAPPRQCDVGTAEDQAERFGKLCGKHYNEEEPCNEKCPLASLPIIHGFPRCQAYWAQTPYEAQGGGKQ